MIFPCDTISFLRNHNNPTCLLDGIKITNICKINFLMKYTSQKFPMKKLIIMGLELGLKIIE